MTKKLNPRVVAVQPESDYTLRLTFTTGEVRIFDMTPYLAIGIFQALRDPRVFNSVRPFLGSVQWPNEADLCPDTLYERSKPVSSASRRRLQVVETPAKYTAKRKKNR